MNPESEMKDNDVTAIWQLLLSNGKLERDQGNAKLERAIIADENLIPIFLDLILTNQISTDLSWQSKLGILSAATILSKHTRNEALLNLVPTAIQWLSDDEVRVRLSSGDFLGALCSTFGPQIYEDNREVVFKLVKENIDRAFAAPEPMDTSETSGRMSPQEEILHDTAGWRNLESSVKCLQSLVNGCGDKFRNYIDQDLLDLIFQSLQHQNRFVRETGYLTCATIIQVADDPVLQFATQFAHCLAEGLADNWSQVRMAAAMASRQFLIVLQKCRDSHQEVIGLLLPRLCLNRYYLAEGVRIYSQETWVQLVGKEGKSLVEKDIERFVKYYVECTKADNHAVREAACQCIAELASKINAQVVEPHVDLLLDTLIEGFMDDSWPVRDMACVACGSFVASFPGPSKKKLPTLQKLFLDNLQDPISSVRQGAAQALAKTVKVYAAEDPEMVQNLMKMMTETLENVKNQPVESHRFGDLTTEPATFGVVKQLRDNDPRLHENQTMYSCGSLAPKMKRSGGCSDCKFKKPSEPWEAADGCLYLICEMSSIPACLEQVAQLLPKVEEAVRHRHYTMHYHLLETMARVLPSIAKGLGKRLFKPHLERFFDHLFYAFESDENSLAASTASQECLRHLAQFLGVNILKGRVEQYNPNYGRLINEILDGSGPMVPTFTNRPPPPSSGAMMIPAPNRPPTLGGTPTGSPC